jgi:hypothetical protein
MNTTAIDLDMLNELLENQKKLDVAFNLSFDDDFFLENPTPLEKPATNNKITFKIEAPTTKPETRSLAHIIVPVAVEIAAISYSILYFN